MTEPVLVFNSVFGVLALLPEDVQAARQRADEIAGAVVSPPQTKADPVAPAVLADAKELARLTSSTASWWEAAARTGDIPGVVYVGNKRRFSVAAALKWLDEVQERDSAGRARGCSFAPRAGD